MTIDATATPDVLSELRAIRAALKAVAKPPAELLDRKAMAQLLGIGISTFDRMKACRQVGPAELRVGGAVKFRRVEVLAWLDHPTPAGDLHDARTWPAIWQQLQARNR